MITVGDVLEFLETLAPRYMKMDWDHVGLLCGRSGREVRRILVALDPFQDVCQEAADWGAELLVTHHPLIFQPPRSITDDTSVGRCILFLAARDMAAINAHTNLDCAPGGVNDCLAGALGLEETVVLNPSGTDGQGRPWGLLRAGRTLVFGWISSIIHAYRKTIELVPLPILSHGCHSNLIPSYNKVVERVHEII